jgi:hypothetical protein
MVTNSPYLFARQALASLRNSLETVHPGNSDDRRWPASLVAKYGNNDNNPLHIGFFKHLDYFLGIRGIRALFVDNTRLELLHNGFYAITLANSVLLGKSPDTEKQDLKQLLSFITDRESAKPWFDYHKLLIDKEVIDIEAINKAVLGYNKNDRVLPNLGLHDVVELQGDKVSSRCLLDFLQLLKPESLKVIHETYKFKDLFPPGPAIYRQQGLFNILSNQFIKPFAEKIQNLSSELQIKLFKDLLDINDILSVSIETMSRQNKTFLLNPLNSPENIIQLFINTLQKSSTDSFSKAVENSDLKNFVEKLLPLSPNPFSIEPASQKLYELALSHKNLSYDDFQKYINELSKLLENFKPSKEILQEALQTTAELNPSETLSISLLKQLAHIFDLETIISEGLFPVISLPSSSGKRDSEIYYNNQPIYQEDIIGWLEKIEQRFDTSEEPSKTNIAGFIKSALNYPNNKASFIVKSKVATSATDPMLFEFNNEEQSQGFAFTTIADSPPYMDSDQYADAMAAAHRVAREAINQSGSFWSLAWLARSLPQNITGPVEALLRNPQSLGNKSTLEQFAEHLSLRPFQRLTSRTAQDYPGTGFIINGLNLPKILGFKDVSDNDIESKSIYRLWINSIESLLSKDPKNSGYFQNRYNLSGVMEDAAKSRFILARGFIAITPPDKLLYSIRCSDKEDLKEYTDNSTNKYYDYTDGEGKLHKTSRWNIIPEPFSLIVFNDHFGDHKNHEKSYLVPTKVLETALSRSVQGNTGAQDRSTDTNRLDFTNAKMKLKDLQDIAKEMELPLLDLASSSNIGSLSNAFPKGWPTYHDWENNLDRTAPHETSDHAKTHYHKTHYRGRGYESDMTPYMNLIYPLQEAENNIDHTASSLQGIFKVLELSLNSFINGRSFINSEELGLMPMPVNENTRNIEENAHYMLARAYKINSALSAERAEKKQFPILVKSDDFTRLSHLPAPYPQLDTYTMVLKTLDENNNVQEERLNPDPNNPDTLYAFLRAFIQPNINPDNSRDIFKGMYFMPRDILFKKPDFTRDHYKEIIKEIIKR